ncbi:MAG: hypothetical protein ABMA25_23635 [Ilumatobacteraceae bacterium]
MLRRGVLAAVLLATVLSACSSDSESKPSGTAAPVASDSPAPIATGDGGSSGAALDCAVLEPLVSSVIVNIQILAQLPGQTDVAQWPVGIGTMPEFGAQLDALVVLVPFDGGVAEQLDFFRGANEIAQRGYAGDAAAPTDLAAYLGSDITAVLTRQIPIGSALAAAGC